MEELFLHLVNMSLAASPLILLVVLARWLMKKAPRWIICLLWAVVALRLICPFSFESPIGLMPSQPPVTESQVNAILPGIVIQEMDAPQIEIAPVTPHPAEAAPAQITFTEIATVIWAVGVSAMLLYLLVSYLRLRYMVQEAIPLCQGVWLCDAVKTPFILGVVFPKIYLPSGIRKRDMVFVIAHETAHLKRKDHCWKPLSFLLLSVFWFNPLIWVAYLLMSKDIELACDEKVIHNLGMEGKKAYSSALLECSSSSKLVFACPVAFGEVAVKDRIFNILNYKKPAFWIVAVSLVVILIGTICFMATPPKADEENMPQMEGIGGGVEFVTPGVQPPAQWPIEVTGFDYTESGITLSLTRNEGYEGELGLCEEYWLEQWYGDWYRYPLWKQPEFGETTEPLLAGKTITREINWIAFHDELGGPALYRIGINVAGHNSANELVKGVYYFEFDLPEHPENLQTRNMWDITVTATDISDSGATITFDRRGSSYSGELRASSIVSLAKWNVDYWESLPISEGWYKPEEQLPIPANEAFTIQEDWIEHIRVLESGTYRLEVNVYGKNARGEECHLTYQYPFELAENGVAEPGTYHDEFVSTDGVATFHMDIPSQDLVLSQASSVTVRPIEISGEEAHRVAQVLFGDVEFFEYPTNLYNKKYSRAEIEAMLERWAPYTDPEMLKQLFPQLAPQAWQDYSVVVQKFIDEYTWKKDQASANPHKQAAWEFKSFSELYFGNHEPIDNQNPYRIETRQYVGEIPFRYIVDISPIDGCFKTLISVSPDTGDSPIGIDALIYQNQLWSVEKPTDAQINSAMEKTAALLERMQLGTWVVDQCGIQTATGPDGNPIYAIYVGAVPSVNGTPVLRDPYNDSSLYSQAEFVLNAEGELCSMKMDAPMELIEAQQVAEIPEIESLLKTAKDGLSEHYTVDHCGRYTVDIDSTRYYLYAEPTGGSDGVFQYTPVLGLCGQIAYEREDGNDYFGTRGSQPRILLDLTDGAIRDYRLPRNDLGLSLSVNQ